MNHTSASFRRPFKGFTLTELLIAVSILGVLSTIAVPNFTRQFTKTKQSEAVATLTQLQQKLASYVDVYKAPPPSWKSLSDYSLVMTASGPASETTAFTTTTIALPGNNYDLDAKLVATNLYTLSATPKNSQANQDGYNAVACLDLNNGATDYKKGPMDREPENETKGPSANEQDLVCRACMAAGTC